MNGSKKLALWAAAVAVPLSVLAPAAAEAKTVPTTAVPTTAVAQAAESAASKKPKVKVWDYEYNEDDDTFDVELKYKCYKKGKNKKGYLYASVYQDWTDTYYWGDTKAKCDGKWRYKWVEAEHDESSDSVEEGDLTVGAYLEDPRGKYAYKEKVVFFSF